MIFAWLDPTIVREPDEPPHPAEGKARKRTFIADLRELSARKENAQDRFKSAVALKWRLGEQGPYVGMTEE